MKRKLIRMLRSWYMTLIYLFRDKAKRQVFFSSLNRKYSDSQKSICEALHALDPNIELVWEINGTSTAPNYVKRVSGHLQVKKSMAQSKVWVTDSSYEWKPSGIYSIAVWHGDRGFKKILHSAHTLEYNMGDTIDLFTVGSKFGERVVANEMFHYNGEILSYGLPRNDKLVNHHSFYKVAVEIKYNLGINENTKVLLYAPTFRDNEKSMQKTIVDVKETLNALETNNENWICLLRAHHCTKRICNVEDSRVIDVTEYEDMADLLLISDCLISDYSSCICDFILLERPCVLAHYDREEYEKNSRTFCVDPDAIGFPIAKTQSEMNEIMKHIYEIDFHEVATKVNSYYKTNETGFSSLEVAKRIISRL